MNGQRFNQQKRIETKTENAIVIQSLLTKECATFSDVSVFGVRTENGSFLKRTFFKFMRYH